ncbi:glycosyltransferase family 61 protein [Aeromicrobium massiliense]|uniref:glycosyltransferase family 61 protein n=1 Tax=Aeromicrobium massiliense TaxID=1464554 RepID=UPI0005781BD6|nr:glycosyltransferase 61 family protein [Aeromicrobium massiliense]
MQRADALRWPVEPSALALRVLAAVAQAPGRPRVLVVGHKVRAWKTLVREACPQARISTARPDDDPAARHVRLIAKGPFDLVVDVSDETPDEQLEMFRAAFMHLREGGTFVASALVAPEPGATGANDLWSVISTATATRLRDLEDHLDRGRAFRPVRGLAFTLGDVELDDERSLRVVLARAVRPSVDEEETRQLLETKPSWGAVLATRPRTTWTPDLTYRSSIPDDPHVRATFSAPPLMLRRYDRAVAGVTQVVTTGRVVLCDTYRRPWDRVSQRVERVGDRFGRVLVPTDEPEPLPGAYFHLDSEEPAHFGHMLTEQISRLWAWSEVRALEPDVKLLLTLPPSRTEMAPHEREIARCLGLDETRVQLISGPVRPERLYAATPMFSQPRYVHPEITAVWDLLGDSLASRASGTRPATRLFVSRRDHLLRACRNVDEVERWFEDRGFQVVFPEEHSLPDQVAMFRGAEAVAGFAGSGLFNLAFVPRPTRVFTIGHRSYDARNEYLIAAARGHELTSVWSTPEIAHPANAWSNDAFRSPFTFDFDDEGRFLARELDRLDSSRH